MMKQLITIYNMAQPGNNIPPYTFGGGQSPTLMGRMGTGGNQVPIIHKIDMDAVCVGNGQLAQAKLSDKVGALNCMHDQQAIMKNKTVRRLTPTECERLQGLPDGYTDISLNGKPASDSARYKALGNGMAQPVADFVLRRIAEVNNESDLETD